MSGGDGLGNYPLYGDPASFSGGCSMEGGPISCDVVGKAISRNFQTYIYNMITRRFGWLERQVGHVMTYDDKAHSTVVNESEYSFEMNVVGTPGKLVEVTDGYNMLWLSLQPEIYIYPADPQKHSGGRDISQKEKDRLIRKNLERCVRDLFRVDLKQFTPAAPREAGQFVGFGYVKDRNEKREFTVRTNTWLYSMYQLTAWYNAFQREHPEYRARRPGELGIGLTLPVWQALRTTTSAGSLRLKIS